MNNKNKAWMSILSMMLAVCMLFSSAPLMAQEHEEHAQKEESSKIDMTSLSLATSATHTSGISVEKVKMR